MEDSDFMPVVSIRDIVIWSDMVGCEGRYSGRLQCC